MNRLTKKLISFLASAALLTLPASAGDFNIRILREDGENGAVVQKIRVEGTADKFLKNEQVTLRVLPKNGAGSLELPSSYLLTAQEFINEDGSFLFEKKLDAEPSDVSVYVNSVNDTFESAEIYLPSADGIKAMISGLNSGAVTNASAAEKVDEDNKNLVFDTTVYSELNQSTKEKIFSDMRAEGVPFTVTNIYNMFDKYTLLNALQEKSSASDVEKILSNYESRLLNLKNEKVYATFDALGSTSKGAVYSGLGNKEYDDVSDIKEAFFEKTVVTAVKNVDSHLNIFGILDAYKSELGISSDVEQMRGNSDLKDTVLRYVIYDKTNFDTTNALADKVKFAIANPEEVKRIMNLVPPQPSLGGGGGGGGGGATVTLPEAINSGNSETEMSIKTGFTDLDSVPWAKDAINSLADKGIIKGKQAGIFAPQDKITRAEIVKMLVEAMGVLSENEVCVFSDLKGHWAEKYVASAYGKGYISGKSKNVFGANENITREDAAVILYRILNIEGKATKIEDLTVYESYADESEISEYAKSSISMMSAYGLISGYEDKTVKPKGSLTRAEAAVLINRFLSVQ